MLPENNKKTFGPLSPKYFNSLIPAIHVSCKRGSFSRTPSKKYDFFIALLGPNGLYIAATEVEILRVFCFDEDSV